MEQLYLTFTRSTRCSRRRRLLNSLHCYSSSTSAIKLAPSTKYDGLNMAARLPYRRTLALRMQQHNQIPSTLSQRLTVCAAWHLRAARAGQAEGCLPGELNGCSEADKPCSGYANRRKQGTPLEWCSAGASRRCTERLQHVQPLGSHAARNTACPQPGEAWAPPRPGSKASKPARCAGKNGKCALHEINTQPEAPDLESKNTCRTQKSDIASTPQPPRLPLPELA